MELRDRIKTARKALGISQEALARRADVSLSLINQIERGVIVDPHYSTLVGIAEALSISISELLGEPVPLGNDPSSDSGAARGKEIAGISPPPSEELLVRAQRAARAGSTGGEPATVTGSASIESKASVRVEGVVTVPIEVLERLLNAVGQVELDAETAETVQWTREAISAAR